MSKRKFKLSKKEVRLVRYALELVALTSTMVPDADPTNRDLFRVGRYFGLKRPKPEKPKPVKPTGFPIGEWADLAPKKFTSKLNTMPDRLP